MTILPGTLVTPAGVIKGFDCNTTLTAQSAKAFYDHGERFVVRYVRRGPKHAYDLTAQEANVILSAGLGLMAVQHVESADAWTPSRDKALVYGQAAVEEMKAIGFPPGAMCWLDLEGVTLGTPARTVITYCNAWYHLVSIAGYLPGLYVGWRCGLTGQQLYQDLRFTRYWGAYNVNRDQSPVPRGFCMKQGPYPGTHAIPVTFAFDTDLIQADAKGDVPMVLAPLGWLEGDG